MLTRGFEVIPAIDVLDGRAVRLAQGRPDSVAVEGGDPAALARRWAAEGASRIHLVDLGGAFSGTWHAALVRRVARVGLPVQFGGGLRAIDDLEAALEAGADRVMVGTASLQADFIAAAVARVGAALVVAVDAREGRVAVEGWRRTEPLTPGELARRCATAGVPRLLVTSTLRDGTLAGPDLPLLAQALEAGLPVLAAGGIATVADLVAVRDAGCEGVVVGSALLQGRFRIAEAAEALAPAP